MLCKDIQSQFPLSINSELFKQYETIHNYIYLKVLSDIIAVNQTTVSWNLAKMDCFFSFLKIIHQWWQKVDIELNNLPKMMKRPLFVLLFSKWSTKKIKDWIHGERRVEKVGFSSKYSYLICSTYISVASPFQAQCSMDFF